MRETYNVGLDDNEIYLEVKIGTPGLAHTIVFLFSHSTTYEIIKESDADSGNIEKTIIGMADGLAGNFLQIRSTVDFGTIDPGFIRGRRCKKNSFFFILFNNRCGLIT